MDSTQEAALIQSAQAGDQQAFELLLNKRYDTIYRFALKWCGAVPDAEDIAQQACIKLAQGIRQFRGDSAFTTWLYRLVINCAKDWQRSQDKHPPHNDEQPAQQQASMNPGEHQIYLRQVILGVAQMGEGFKETLLLVFAEGLNHKEAADVLGIKESTVSWRIHQMRKHMNLLTAEGGKYE